MPWTASSTLQSPPAMICLRLRCPESHSQASMSQISPEIIEGRMKRREFLSLAGAAAVQFTAGTSLECLGRRFSTPRRAAADYSLRIQPLNLELAPGINIQTVGYNGQVPGPLLRLKEGVPVSIEVF